MFVDGVSGGLSAPGNVTFGEDPYLYSRLEA